MASIAQFVKTNSRANQIIRVFEGTTMLLESADSNGASVDLNESSIEFKAHKPTGGVAHVALANAKCVLATPGSITGDGATLSIFL